MVRRQFPIALAAFTESTYVQGGLAQADPKPAVGHAPLPAGTTGHEPALGSSEADHCNRQLLADPGLSGPICRRQLPVRAHGEPKRRRRERPGLPISLEIPVALEVPVDGGSLAVRAR